MGVLYDYFAAPSDDVAAAVLFAKDDLDRDEVVRRTPLADFHEAGLPAVVDRGIDPAIALTQLGSLLVRGRLLTVDEVVEVDNQRIVADRDGGLCLVIALGDDFLDDLAMSSDERLAALVEPWSQIGEFAGSNTDALGEFVEDLADLARIAIDRDAHLYCRVVA